MRHDVLKLILVTMVLGGFLLAGCLGGEQPPVNETNQTVTPPVVVKTPVISITSPTNGQVIMSQGDSTDVELVLSAQNLVLKQPGGAAKKGEGYFKITIDGANSATVTSKTFGMPALAVGTHTVKVELMNNDRTPYSPPIKKEVSFSIEKEKPLEYVPQSYTITIRDFSYDPADLSVKVSDSVTFVNSGAYPRSATCFNNGKEVFDSKVLGPGQSITLTMSQVAYCEYYSTTFRAMTGKLNIESNGFDNQ